MPRFGRAHAHLLVVEYGPDVLADELDGLERFGRWDEGGRRGAGRLTGKGRSISGQSAITLFTTSFPDDHATAHLSARHHPTR
jgi:hypothetical protein